MSAGRVDPLTDGQVREVPPAYTTSYEGKRKERVTVRD